MHQHCLAVTKTMPELQSELDALRAKHSIGISKKLGQIKTIRTAMLKAEVNGGKVRVKPRVKSKPAHRQSSFDLVAA